MMGVTVTAFTPPRHYHTTAPLRRTKKNTNTGGTPSHPASRPFNSRYVNDPPSEDLVRLREQYLESVQKLALAYETEVTKISSRGKKNTKKNTITGGTPPAVLSCTERFIELLSVEKAPVKNRANAQYAKSHRYETDYFLPTCPTDSPRTDPTVLTTMKFSGGMPIHSCKCNGPPRCSAHASMTSPTFSCINLDRQNEKFAAHSNARRKNDEFTADINARLKKACTYMVLLGHPGIGKSMALNFLVHNLLKVGRSVVVLKNNVGATSVHVFNCADETVEVTMWDALSIPVPVLNCLMGAHRRNATATSTAPGRPARRPSD